MILASDVLLEALSHRESVPSADLADAVLAGASSSSDWSLRGLIELGTRLPSGLIHAEAIWVLASPPEGLEPLAAGSSWFAMDRSLVVAMRPERRELLELLRDLGRYAILAGWVRDRLFGHDDLIAALRASFVDARAAAELALRLEAPPELWGDLDALAPTLRQDLAWMACSDFDIVVRLHAHVRPARRRARGADVGAALLRAIPQGRFRLTISDGVQLIEHLSPYVRDLGHALTTWGRENQPRLTTLGLAEALDASSDRPDPDLSALVVPDLMDAAPDLFEERRQADEPSSLYLTRDYDGAVHGWADLGRLSSLGDPRAVPSGASGALAVLARCPDDVLLGAAAVLLESGRVDGLSIALSMLMTAPRVVVPDALLMLEDAVSLDGIDGIAERAAAFGVDLARAGALPVDDLSGVPQVAGALLGMTRKARVTGRLAAGARVLLVLYARDPKSGATLDQRLTEVNAARLALSCLITSEMPRRGRKMIRA